MAMTWSRSLLIGVCLLGQGLGSVRAADITFFDAAKAQPADWALAGLSAQRMGAMWLFTDNDPAAIGGSALARSFPYIPGAEINFKLNGLTGGNGSLELVFLSAAGAQLGTAELASFKGQYKAKIDQLPEAPAGTAAVGLKLTLSGQEGAKAQLGDLSYAFPTKGKKPLADEDSMKGDLWVIESLDRRQAQGPRRFGLREGDKSGCILFNLQIPWSPGNAPRCLIHLPVVEKGKVTVQVQPLDEGNQAQPAVDGLQGIGAGWHALNLGELQLDDASRKVVLKFWLFGDPDAEFALDRLVIIAP